MSSTIQYLKKLNVHIEIKAPGDQAPLALTAHLNNFLRSFPSRDIIAYTDGSTDKKSPSKNSGAGLVITDQQNNPIWTGGLVVRSDGNNFIPELAAAAIAVKAVPLEMHLTL